MKPTCLQRGSHVVSILSILAAFFSSRLLCSAFVYLGHSRREYLSPVRGGWEGVQNWWLNPWTTYDSEWYLRIALHGYDTNSAAFFPLYPWLLRLCSDNQLQMALAGVVISHVSLLVAFILVFRLTEIEWNRKTAHLVVWILAYIPAAPFWGAVYTESFFLLCLTATFLAVRTERWWLAGLFGGMAALCRNPGLLIAAALFIEGMCSRQPCVSWGRRLAWLFPLTAFVVVQSFLWLQLENPLAGATAHIYRSLDWPWMPVSRDVLSIFTEKHSIAYMVAALTGLTFTIIPLLMTIIAWRKIRSGYLLLVAGITMMNLVYAYQISPQTISATRYMAPLFPVVQYLATIISRNISSRGVFLFTGSWLFLFIIFSYLFGLKSYLG